ncbi:hypothetical protein FKW77_004369 [Venturia effusa]|uniref:Acyl-CoA thioesterase 8 n=1 Tax=Venturia effusa TaxID=50376 RepID=A0A517LK20_9PEZI|nr:hypothetical protein FKW77_004369 [Venturia effusa]
MPGEEWYNGNSYRPLRELFGLVRINERHFESECPAYSPGGFTRAYGGHVFAQSAYAAAQTVREGMVVHNITGWFTLQGQTDRPFVYRVENIREGGSYCQRQVNVTQDASKGVCFTCICSFKKAEVSNNERQLDFDLREKYKAVLRGKKAEDWPECPGIDSPYWWEIEQKRGWIDPFPGLSMRKVDMAAYNHPRKTLDRRQLQYYKVIGEMPSLEEDPNLHAIAHLYASDRNGLFPIPNFLDLGDEYLAIASLSHTVIFHVEALGLRMVQEDGSEPWFVVETAIDKIAHGRAFASHRLWREDGLHVASCFQDGMLRMPPEGESIGQGRMIFGDSETLKDEKKAKL